jgi:putative nucleotidyltransferase with HDIG domain
MSELFTNTQEIIDSVKNVPALSPGATQLLGVIAGSDYDVADIVKVIENDSALTANVLKVVNSAAMGLRREIVTVHEAVAYIGETKVVGIALASSTGDTFNAALPGYHGDRGDLGRHCLWVAIAARELARHTIGVVDPGVAFTAGLLHDIGKAVISDFMADLVDAIIEDVDESPDVDHLAAEKKNLGTDHCEIGAALARHWKMPETLVKSIEHHHRPAEAPDEVRAMAYVIHLADTLAMMQGFDTGVDSLQYKFDPDYSTFVTLETLELEGLSLDVQVDFKGTAEALFGDEQENEE